MPKPAPEPEELGVCVLCKTQLDEDGDCPNRACSISPLYNAEDTEDELYELEQDYDSLSLPHPDDEDEGDQDYEGNE